MGSTQKVSIKTVGVLALQGAFEEHLQLLRSAGTVLNAQLAIPREWQFIQVRTPNDLSKCDALIIPGGESTAISLVAQRSSLLEPLRDFVKIQRKPTWGTCAGLILLAESANRTKKGGQELIGGLDVRVNRNHFGRQVESFQANLNLPFLKELEADTEEQPYRGIFIRAPIVEKILPTALGIQKEESKKYDTVVAPSREANSEVPKQLLDGQVEVLATLPGRGAAVREQSKEMLDNEIGDIIAVRQGNVFGTSFHPELTGDPRIHVWWLKQAIDTAEQLNNESSA